MNLICPSALCPVVLGHHHCSLPTLSPEQSSTPCLLSPVHSSASLTPVFIPTACHAQSRPHSLPHRHCSGHHLTSLQPAFPPPVPVAASRSFLNYTSAHIAPVFNFSGPICHQEDTSGREGQVRPGSVMALFSSTSGVPGALDLHSSPMLLQGLFSCSPHLCERMRPQQRGLGLRSHSDSLFTKPQPVPYSTAPGITRDLWLKQAIS